MRNINNSTPRSLKQLAALKNGLTALNKVSADEYSQSAADYFRAARLANQVKTDLNDISRRLTYVGTCPSFRLDYDYCIDLNTVSVAFNFTDIDDPYRLLQSTSLERRVLKKKLSNLAPERTE